MSNAIILMTALVPTIGHKYLIDFARSLIDDKSNVHVIVGTLEREPIPGILRYQTIKEIYKLDPKVIVHHLNRDVPQEPNEHPDFWNVWKHIVLEFVNVQPNDFFVASELYGIDMSNVLGCKFMPCNRYRETVKVKGSDVRYDLINKFDFILPEFQKYIRKTITIFGAESCGKTTMTKKLSNEMNGWFIPEWAREYLETIGAEVTDEKMQTIVTGQFAIQHNAQFNLFNKPWIFQDTDLFSTVGYYRLYGGPEIDAKKALDLAIEMKSDMYIVMNDQIPFEPDPLRYGGNKRESGTQYWIDLLEEFELPYYIVKSTDNRHQLLEITKFLYQYHYDQFKHIREYVRD